MHAIVFDTLQKDKASRVLNPIISSTEIDIYTFDDLKQNEWDYSLPTLITGRNRKIVWSLEQFMTSFGKQFPFKINMDNLLLAGGSIGDIVTRDTSRSINDFDLFFYGLTIDEATHKVDQVIHELITSYEQYLRQKEQSQYQNKDSSSGKKQSGNTSKSRASDDDGTVEMKSKIILPPKYDFKCIRNKNCVTIIFDDIFTIQFILRLYKSKSEILHGFDLGSSAIGFDGQQLYFTSLSKFAYEYSCNIVDPSRRSTTYEHRLIKYFDRGFDLIVPNFDRQILRNVNSKYSVDDVCELPHMAFTYKDVKGNKIIVHKFLSPKPSRKGDYSWSDLDESKIFYINLNNVVMTKAMTDFYFYSQNPGKPLAQSPLISRRRVIDYYDKLMTKLRGDGEFNIKMLRRYVRNPVPILNALIDNTISESGFNVLCDRELNTQKQQLLGTIDQILNQSYPLTWLTENPGTQLTSSFNPIIEDACQWYGSYFTTTPCVNAHIDMIVTSCLADDEADHNNSDSGADGDDD